MVLKYLYDRGDQSIVPVYITECNSIQQQKIIVEEEITVVCWVIRRGGGISPGNGRLEYFSDRFSRMRVGSNC
jgi:hypothetical protein